LNVDNFDRPKTQSDGGGRELVSIASKDTKEPRTAGREPSNEFRLKNNCLSFVKLPISEGMVPLKEFTPRWR
jgi:hypothetical protein